MPTTIHCTSTSDSIKSSNYGCSMQSDNAGAAIIIAQPVCRATMQSHNERNKRQRERKRETGAYPSFSSMS
jgi:hypothetical protein